MKRPYPRGNTAAGERTIARFLTAAREMFLEKGYFETSTDDILRRAGRGSKSQLYGRYGNKEQLFRACFEGRFDPKLVEELPIGQLDALIQVVSRPHLAEVVVRILEGLRDANSNEDNDRIE